MKYDIVIWDFNGTVLDDTGVSIEAINTVMKARGMNLLGGKADLQNIFCFPVKKYYGALGFDFEKEPFEVPADEWVALYDKQKFSAPLTDGVIHTLEVLHAAGVRQVILSASEKKLLIDQLTSHGITDLFDDILGAGDFYAEGKIGLAKQWAKANHLLDPRKVLLIGDTNHDFMCAEEIGCDCVLYSGGFMSKERLLPLGCTVIDSICELIPIVLF